MEKINRKSILLNLANAITAVGIISSAAFLMIATYHPEQLWLIFIVGMIVSITDLLDGWVAKELKISSPIGRVLDQFRDRFFIFPAMAILVWNYRWKAFSMPFYAMIIAKGCLIALLLLEIIILLTWTVGIILYFNRREIDFRPNKWGKRKTFCGFTTVMMWILSLAAEQHLNISMIEFSCWLIILGMILMVWWSLKSIGDYWTRIKPER